MHDAFGVGLVIAVAIVGPTLLVVGIERLHSTWRDYRAARKRQHLHSKGGYRR